MKDSAGKKQKTQKLEKTETAYMMAEDALRASEDNFRRFLDESPLGVRIVTAGGETLYANRAILDFYGYDSIEELKTTPVEKRYTKDSFAQYQIRRKKRKDGVDSTSEYEISISHKKGEIRHLQVYRKEILWNGEMQYQAIYQDITERKQAEESLRQSEIKYRLIFEHSPVGILYFDENGVIIACNYNFIKIIGSSREALIGLNMIKLPDKNMVSAVQKALNGETGLYEGVYSSVTAKKATATRAIFTPMASEDGIILGGVGIIEDITERYQGEKQLQDTLESLRKAVGTTIQVMVSAVEARDPYTAGHQKRSASLARVIATEMGLSQEKIDGIRMAGSIHDIGKLSIPAEILSKPTKLSEIEFSLIKEHALNGYEILKNIESPSPLSEIVYQHHERMDGSGYPRNLKGNDILIEARILIVADVVEAMASHRPYRPSLGIDAALEEIENNRGIIYDKAVVDACLRLFRKKGFKLEGT
jgi:PAS domain S-box-containing protein